MLTAHATLGTWLAEHAYLQELARFEQLILEEQHSHEARAFSLPSLENCADDFSKGIPLLRSAAPDPAFVSTAGRDLIRLADRLSASDAPEKTRAACALLRDELRQFPDEAERLIAGILADKTAESTGALQSHPGLSRFLCWKTLRPLLGQWIDSAPELSKTIVWGRPHCPVCGSLPAMGQLSQTKKGRERFLSCGCCGNTWTFSRTTCPFCENHDQDKLEILEAEQEELFRIDVCRECNGYLKTYLNEGDEELFLSDWSTLHLDVLAKNKGLMRRADSLYEL